MSDDMMSGGFYGAMIDGINQQAFMNQQSAFNAKSARENRKFQDYMDSTKYRRAAEDLREAGFNPLLAAGGLVGGSGSGSSAQMSAGQPSKFSEAIIAHMNARSNRKAVQNEEQKIKNEKEKIDADISLSRQLGNAAEAKAMLDMSESAKAGRYLELINEQIETEKTSQGLNNALATKNYFEGMEAQLREAIAKTKSRVYINKKGKGRWSTPWIDYITDRLGLKTNVHIVPGFKKSKLKMNLKDLENY